MYERFGYSVYRRVLGYYSGPSPEDALGEFCGDEVLRWGLPERITMSSGCDEYYIQAPTISLAVTIADMRKAMPRDVNKLSIVPLKRAIHPHELEFD